MGKVDWVKHTPESVCEKYEFTGETRIWQLSSFDKVRILHRIRRCSDGLIGGWIESPLNLAFDGDCFVYGEAKVYDNARVCGDSEVFDKALVYGNAEISGACEIRDEAEIFENAEVSGYVLVKDNARICASAIITGEAVIEGHAKICEKAEVSAKARVGCFAEVFGTAIVTDEAKIYDRAKIHGNARILSRAFIADSCNIKGWAVVKGKVCGFAIIEDTGYIGERSYAGHNSIIRGKVLDNTEIKGDITVEKGVFVENASVIGKGTIKTSIDHKGTVTLDGDHIEYRYSVLTNS